MTTADLDVLLSMGFEQARAEIAAKKTGNCKHHRHGHILSCHSFSAPVLTLNAVQQALDWLEANQDKSLEELQAQNQASAEDEDEDTTGANIPSGETAKSLVCNECGKKFRNHDQATFHATKTFVSNLTSFSFSSHG